MKQPAAGLLLVVGAFLTTGCDSSGTPQNYQYFKDHPDEARNVIGECRLNGTRGMEKDRQAVCQAANAAEWSTKYENSKEHLELQQRQQQQDVQRRE